MTMLHRPRTHAAPPKVRKSGCNTAPHVAPAFLPVSSHARRNPHTARRLGSLTPGKPRTGSSGGGTPFPFRVTCHRGLALKTSVLPRGSAPRLQSQSRWHDLGATGQGTKKHSYAKDLVDRYQNRFGSRGLRAEESNLNRFPANYGTKGGSRFDIYDEIATKLMTKSLHLMENYLITVSRI